MSYDLVTFEGKIAHVVKSYKWYPNRVAELNAIATALNTDPTTHDMTLKRAPAGLQPSSRANTPFTNDILLIVNRAKGGNLPNTTMASMILAALPVELPVNTVPPAASIVTGGGAVGSVLTCSLGTWTGSPTLVRQWMSGGTTIGGATATTYTTQASDQGNNVTCRVSGTNSAGTTQAMSNAIAIT